MPIQTFRCQFCETEYSTFALAEKCEQELSGVDKNTVFDWAGATVRYKPGQGYYSIGTGKVTGIFICGVYKEKGRLRPMFKNARLRINQARQQVFSFRMASANACKSV